MSVFRQIIHILCVLKLNIKRVIKNEKDKNSNNNTTVCIQLLKNKTQVLFKTYYTNGSMDNDSMEISMHSDTTRQPAIF